MLCSFIVVKTVQKVLILTARGCPLQMDRHGNFDHDSSYKINLTEYESLLCTCKYASVVVYFIDVVVNLESLESGL